MTLMAGVGACDGLAPPDQDPWLGGVSREGPAAAWTVQVATGGHQVAVLGDVVVVTDEGTLLGLDLTTGRERWRRDVTGEYRISVAGGLVAQQTTDGPLEVVDPATGATRWRDDRPGWRHVVRQEAVYADDCAVRREAEQPGCVVEARALADGAVRWTLPATVSGVRDDRIGTREPVAPASGKYLLAGIGDRGAPFGAVDTRTGRPLKGRIGVRGWYAFVVGDVLVSTDHDPPRGDRRCTVTVTGVAAADGAARWSGAIYSGRRADNECAKTLADRENGAALIGTGSRVAAVTEGGRPQLVDLATGDTVWTADGPGAPIDGYGTALLVRQFADQGPFRLLDVESGRERWTVPDTGLPGTSASWASAVTGGLVAVSGATGDRPFVLVHEVDSGKQLGRFPSWLAGAGDDWVAVTRGTGVRELTLEFVRF
ncbi:PQQ-binding-like beta-propeller repeat protein [Micromonospora echinofusca]|uniref:PQQ-binding-like beta-propeller repeat protein n=1 Tax=Micromonospora echinofusca TaxID=47858 RepID=A0ABS3VZ75_MICEH|nr:PQQ-binding-like beta-propeller repeat protein [Micromonospora echinofusca]